jgi:hypothetical protein
MRFRPIFAALFVFVAARGAVNRSEDAAAALVPCIGKSCGQPCTMCPPDQADCLETAISKYCNEEGACMPVQPMCIDGL